MFTGALRHGSSTDGRCIHHTLACLPWVDRAHQQLLIRKPHPSKGRRWEKYWSNSGTVMLHSTSGFVACVQNPTNIAYHIIAEATQAIWSNICLPYPQFVSSFLKHARRPLFPPGSTSYASRTTLPAAKCSSPTRPSHPLAKSTCHYK